LTFFGFDLSWEELETFSTKFVSGCPNRERGRVHACTPRLSVSMSARVTWEGCPACRGKHRPHTCDLQRPPQHHQSAAMVLLAERERTFGVQGGANVHVAPAAAGLLDPQQPSGLTVLSVGAYNASPSVRQQYYRCNGCSAIVLRTLEVCPTCLSTAPSAMNSGEEAVRSKQRENLAESKQVQQLTFFRRREQDAQFFHAAG
jgi:hypothetical protein